MKRYSLSKYSVSLVIPAQLRAAFGDTLKIDTNGNEMSSISVTRDENLYKISNYATGGYVFNKNLSTSGSVSLTLNQICDDAARLNKLFNAYFAGDYDGMTITINAIGNEKSVVECIDCYPVKIPDKTFGAEATDINFDFGCGKINYND